MPTDSRPSQDAHDERPSTQPQHHGSTSRTSSSGRHGPDRRSEDTSQRHVAQNPVPHHSSRDPRQTDQSPHRGLQPRPVHNPFALALDTLPYSRDSIRSSTDRSSTHASMHDVESHVQHTDKKHQDTTQGPAGNGDKQTPSTQLSEYYSGASSRRPAGNGDKQHPSTQPHKHYSGASSKRSEGGHVAPGGLAPPTLDDRIPVIDGHNVWSDKSAAVAVDPRHRISSPAPVPRTTNERAAGTELTRNGQDRPRDRPAAARLLTPNSDNSAIPPGYSPPPEYNTDRISAEAGNPAEDPAGNTDNRPSLGRHDDPPLRTRHRLGAIVRGGVRRVTGAIINPFLPSVESRSRNRLRRQPPRHNDDQGGSRTGNGNGRGHGMN